MDCQGKDSFILICPEFDPIETVFNECEMNLMLSMIIITSNSVRLPIVCTDGPIRRRYSIKSTLNTLFEVLGYILIKKIKQDDIKVFRNTVMCIRGHALTNKSFITMKNYWFCLAFIYNYSSSIPPTKAII